MTVTTDVDLASVEALLGLRPRGAFEVVVRDAHGAEGEQGAAEIERWTIEAAGRTIPLRGAYADAAPGELLALVDSYGALEIAVREGSAAARKLPDTNSSRTASSVSRLWRDGSRRHMAATRRGRSPRKYS